METIDDAEVATCEGCTPIVTWERIADIDETEETLWGWAAYHEAGCPVCPECNK